MHVMIDYTPALRQTAGIGRYTRSLVSALAESPTSDRYTLFCAGSATVLQDLPDGFAVRMLPVPSRWLGIAWHRLGLPLPVELFAGDCDIFHSTDFTLPPLRKARGVVTVHDLSFLRLPQCADPGLRTFLQNAVPAAVRRAHCVLADSHSTRRDLLELLDVAPDKIAVVPGGIEPRFRRIQDSGTLQIVRRRYDLPSPFILALGTLEPRKNFARLIRAYAVARHQNRALPHRLVIAGKPGWLYQEIYDTVDREGMREFVHFTGFIDDADLPALYTLADLFVFPSLYEGFGLPPLEAMACGTPVVASNNSSLPEAVGDAALLVDAEDIDGLAGALLRVSGEKALRTCLIERGYAQAAQFTWRRAAEKLLEAYRRVGN